MIPPSLFDFDGPLGAEPPSVKEGDGDSADEPSGAGGASCSIGGRGCDGISLGGSPPPLRSIGGGFLSLSLPLLLLSFLGGGDGDFSVGGDGGDGDFSVGGDGGSSDGGGGDGDESSVGAGGDGGGDEGGTGGGGEDEGVGGGGGGDESGDDDDDDPDGGD